MHRVIPVVAALVTLGCQSQARNRFPVGIYNVAKPQHLSELKARGFDSAFAIPAGIDDFPKMAQEAKRLGMRLFLQPQIFSGHPEKYSKRWPVEAFYLQDEPEVNNVPVQQMEEISRKTKELDPSKLQAFVVGNGDALRPYSHIGDVAMLDWYPVPHMPLDSVADEVDKALGALPKGKPLWAVIQGMNWQDFPQRDAKKPRVGRFPDFAEIRFMTYAAIVHGASGIYFFSFQKPGERTLLDVPEEFQAVWRVAQELISLQPIFENGEPKSIPFPLKARGLEARAWRYHLRDYVIILNRRKDAMLRIPPELLDMKWRPLFEPHRDARELLVGKAGAWYMPPYRVFVFEGRIL